PGEGVAEDPGQGDGGHEPGQHPGPLAGREPEGQVEDDAGEEPRLGHAEQDAHGVEAPRARDGQGGAGNQPPADQDAGDPGPGPDPAQQQIAGHLEEQVAEVEQPIAPVERGLAETQVARHLQRGDAHVTPVEDVEDVEQAKEGDQPPGHLAQDPRRGGGFVGGHGALVLQEPSINPRSAARNPAAGAPSSTRWSKVRLSVILSRGTTTSPTTAGSRTTLPTPSTAHCGSVMIGVNASTPDIPRLLIVK